MLLRYGISNFLSFKEGAEVSFKLDGNVPASISGGRDYASILCIKGANGSGKTHLLKGLAFMANFASRSFSSDPDSGIPVDPFFESSKPSDFFAEFVVGDSSYLYELSVTKHQVVRESLYQTKKRKTKLFERTGTEISAIQRMSEIESIKLRKNASVISTAHQHEIADLEAVYDFGASGYSVGLRIEIQATAMEQNCCPEVVFISEPSCLRDDFLHLRVDSFCRGVGNAVTTVV